MEWDSSRSLLLLSSAAFDEKGYRIGPAGEPPHLPLARYPGLIVWGLAFDCQVFGQIPAEEVSVGFFWKYVLPVFLGPLLLFLLSRYLRQKYPQKMYDVFCLAALVVFVSFSLFQLGNQLIKSLSDISGEEFLPSGYIRVLVEDYPEQWYYCAPYSFFARIPVSEVTSEADSRYE